VHEPAAGRVRPLAPTARATVSSGA
jgi:hypothetical protein